MNLEDNILATGVSDSPLATCHLPLATEKKAAPFFSIIIPVYNVAPYLRECLDSVLVQTFTDWECLCVDDGSTDESGAILDEYAQKDPRFRVFHQANAGVSAARNLGLDNAKGEWIGFLDGDDVWTTKWLEVVAREIETNAQIEWVNVRGCYGFNDGETPCTMTGDVTQKNVFIRDELTIKGWEQISRNSVPWVNFFKLSKVQGLYFAKGIRFREDALFLFEAVTKIRAGVMIDCLGYSQRVRSGSATNSQRRRDDTIKLLTAYLKLWKSLSITSSLKRKILDASTHWIMKDVRQWYLLCPDRTMSDCLKVNVLVWRLLFCSAFDVFSIKGTPFDFLRWTLFLLTGYGKILSFTRLSFKRG